jgi:succinoglycan biosynthesis protein ExoL
VRATYLLPVPSHVRYWKRIRGLEEEGVRPETVLSFRRPYYEGAELPHPVEYLGRHSNRRYAGRIPSLLGSVPRTRRAARSADVLYAFGLDMALLAFLAVTTVRSRPLLVYEVGDIASGQLRRDAVGTAVRWVERRILRRADLLVVTSSAYLSGYYEGWVNVRPRAVRVVENKLGGLELPPRPPAREGPAGVIRIGWFGNLRCPRSWEILKRAAAAAEGRVRVHVRGLNRAVPGLEEEARSGEGLSYGGTYAWPDDLPGMYGDVDLVWAAYPYAGEGPGNWMWARTNRFYESAYFGRPMVVQRGTEDARAVEERGAGLALDLGDPEGSVERLLGLSLEEVAAMASGARSIPESDYLYTDEHASMARLFESLRG